jgi:low temperature requirement protein LtrA
LKARHHLFRARDPHDHSPVTYIELFFDLVFVFAITQLSHRLLATAIGGPILFLIGNQAFKWITSDAKYPPLSHFIGMLFLGSIAFVSWRGGWQPLTIGIATTTALIATAIWEWASLHGGWQRWMPWLARGASLPAS